MVPCIRLGGRGGRDLVETQRNDQRNWVIRLRNNPGCPVTNRARRIRRVFTGGGEKMCEIGGIAKNIFGVFEGVF